MTFGDQLDSYIDFESRSHIQAPGQAYSFLESYMRSRGKHIRIYVFVAKRSLTSSNKNEWMINEDRDWSLAITLHVTNNWFGRLEVILSVLIDYELHKQFSLENGRKSSEKSSGSTPMHQTVHWCRPRCSRCRTASFEAVSGKEWQLFTVQWSPVRKTEMLDKFQK